MPAISSRPRPARPRFVRSRISRLAALALAGLTVAGCEGRTTRASDFNAADNTIRLNAIGSCDTSCTAYFRFRARGTSTWTNTASFNVGRVTDAPFSQRVTVQPGARYEYQACGKESAQSTFSCAGPDGTGATTDKFTGAAPVPVALTVCGETNSEVCRVDANGTETNLSRNPASDGDPIWSPDATRIAFVSDRPSDDDPFDPNPEPTGPNEIWTMHPDGTNQLNLTNYGREDRDPDFSPDGRRIAFASDRRRVCDRSFGGCYYDTDLHVMNADGSSVTRITSTQYSDDAPDWSPTGRRLAFTHQGNLIYLINPDGGDLTFLVEGEAPAWSPDGSRIAFARYADRSDEEYGGDIYVVDADGTNERRLTNGPGSNSSPQWTPDGRISFYSENPDGQGGGEFAAVNLDGTNRTRISPLQRGGPSWTLVFP